MPKFDYIRERTFFHIEFGSDGKMRKLTKSQRGPDLIVVNGEETFDRPMEVREFSADDARQLWRQADTHALFTEGSVNAAYLLNKVFSHREKQFVKDIVLDGEGWLKGVFMRDVS